MTSRCSSGSSLTAASSVSRVSAESSAASGDGAASPEGSSVAARSARCARRPAERRRLRASLATICSSQGRKGAPARKRPSARQALTKPSCAASSASAALPCDHVRRAKGDALVCSHELLVGVSVAALRAADQVGFVEWSAHHRCFYTVRGASSRSARRNYAEVMPKTRRDEPHRARGRRPRRGARLLGVDLRRARAARPRPADGVHRHGRPVHRAGARVERSRPTASATSVSSSTTRKPCERACRSSASRSFGRGLDFHDPWGNLIQVVDYRDVQFTKTDDVLRAMGLDGWRSRSRPWKNSEPRASQPDESRRVTNSPRPGVGHRDESVTYVPQVATEPAPRIASPDCHVTTRQVSDTRGRNDEGRPDPGGGLRVPGGSEEISERERSG